MYIKTDRLIVRNFKKEDVDDLAKLLATESVMKYIEKPYSYEESCAFFKKYGLGDNSRVFAVEDLNNTFIGYIIYGKYNRFSKEIGWVLTPEQQGKGYASEITRALIDLSKKDNTIKYLIIEFVSHNHRSRKIAEKYNFKYLKTDDDLIVYKLVTD